MSSDRDSLVEAGYQSCSRGVVRVLPDRALHDPGNSVGYADRPGVIVLESVAGPQVFLWARFEGGITELRVDNTDPGEDQAPPTSKVVVSFP